MKAILFDMDGVLVDVSASYRQAIKQTVEAFLDQPVSPDTIQAYKNRGGFNNDWHLTHAILGDSGLTVEIKQVIDCFQQFYLGRGFNGLIRAERCLITKQTLTTLRQQYKIGIVTGRPKKEAWYALKRFDIEDFFQVVIAMESVPADRGKPHPMGILLALKQLEVTKACYIGDTIDDIKAAINAGIVPVGIPAPGSNREEQTRLLKQAGAVTVLTDLSTLKNGAIL